MAVIHAEIDYSHAEIDYMYLFLGIHIVASEDGLFWFCEDCGSNAFLLLCHFIASVCEQWGLQG